MEGLASESSNYCRRHDGGSKMILLINGKEECVSSAIYGKGGHNNEETIVNMSACPPGIPLNKGDNIVVKAVYDLASHPLYVVVL